MNRDCPECAARRRALRKWRILALAGAVLLLWWLLLVAAIAAFETTASGAGAPPQSHSFRARPGADPGAG